MLYAQARIRCMILRNTCRMEGALYSLHTAKVIRLFVKNECNFRNQYSVSNLFFSSGPALFKDVQVMCQEFEDNYDSHDTFV